MYQTTNTLNLGGFNYVNRDPSPTAHITVSKNRLRVYEGSNVYLKDGSNFEIELWNPKQVRVLAKIRINGIAISEAGIVVNPGQRVYLERFLDESRKFKFTTYWSEDSDEGREAIEKNGLVQVEFYSEVETWSYRSPYNSTYGAVSGQPNWWITGTSNAHGISFGGTTVSNTYSVSNPGERTDVTNSTEPASFQYFNVNGSLETGRVDRGEASSQNFNYTNGSFNSWPCARAYFKILPESTRPLEAGEIRSYCTGCRARIKKMTWKFCPTCGTSLTE